MSEWISTEIKPIVKKPLERLKELIERLPETIDEARRQIRKSKDERSL